MTVFGYNDLAELTNVMILGLRRYLLKLNMTG